MVKSKSINRDVQEYGKTTTRGHGTGHEPGALGKGHSRGTWVTPRRDPLPARSE